MWDKPLSSNLNESSLTLPLNLLKKEDDQFIHSLFNSLRSAILYFDEWGNVHSANKKAKTLFRERAVKGKNILELVSHWHNPSHCHHELLMVAKTGTSILGSVERVLIDNQECWFRTDKISLKNDARNINGVLMTLDDITDLKNKEIQLRESDSRYRTFITNSQDAIWRYDITPPIPIDWPSEKIAKSIVENGRLGECNAVFAQLFKDGNIESCVGGRLADIEADTIYSDFVAFVSHGYKYNSIEAVVKNDSGVKINIESSATGTIKNGFLTEIWGVSRNNTERQAYIDQLEYQTTHDTLTGLPNRVKLERQAKKIMLEMRSAKQTQGDLALIIVDLDRFKEVNDTLGHHIGDNIIKEIGPRIRSVTFSYGAMVARLGGDEFAILIPKVVSQEKLLLVAKKINAAIKKEFVTNGMVIEIRASIGISLFPSQAHDFSTLLRYADVAMYNAKKTSSVVQLYERKADQHSPKRLLLMSELGKAIRENKLILYYQPKIEIGTNKLIGVEALARWNHETMGFISPAEFIPIAEMSDMINELTDWVLSASLKQVRLWRQQGLYLNVAVNISARNLLNDSILSKIEFLLHSYNLPPSCLELEITESTIMNNAEYSLSILERMHNLGINLSIDDFGTGYSSLAYLKKLPVQFLKIDYAFIINLLEDDQDQIIVRSTINMAHNLGLRVVAEGVENKELLSLLGTMNCEYAQGYHIAHPMPSDEIEKWCKT